VNVKLKEPAVDKNGRKCTDIGMRMLIWSSLFTVSFSVNLNIFIDY